MVEIDEALENRKIDEIEVSRDRIWNLAYADDIVLLAKNKETLENMMCTLGKFLKNRRLEVNAEKSKILVFNRRENERKERWK